jgi:hypothetical protein
MIFMELSEFDYFVQVCCGDGVRTELLNREWWSIAGQQTPRLASEIIFLLALALPVTGLLFLSRSIILKSVLFVFFTWTAFSAGTMFFSQRGHTADRLGCVGCEGYFFFDIILAVVSLFLILGLATYRGVKALN